MPEEFCKYCAEKTYAYNCSEHEQLREEDDIRDLLLQEARKRLKKFDDILAEYSRPKWFEPPTHREFKFKWNDI